MPRITIDYTPAAHQSAGIGRLTREVTRALLALSAPHEYTLFCMGRAAPPSLPPGARFVATPLTDRWLHRIWFRARLPLPVDALAGPADLYHATDFLLPPTFARRTVLTVHDLTFERDPGSAAPTLLRFLQRVVPASARRASHVVADSHATARDLTELRDIETGLVDFPALVQGRQVWLCWRLGEEAVAWWHELDAGVAGRRPLEELG